MTISIVLADDHPVVRRGLRSLLEAEPDVSISAETEDGLETIRQVERMQPNVLVLDLMMPGLGGLDVLPILKHRTPRTCIIVFSMYANEDFVLKALKDGARGYVLKGCDPAHVTEAVRRALAGRCYLSPALAELAFRAFHEKAETAAPIRTIF